MTKPLIITRRDWLIHGIQCAAAGAVIGAALVAYVSQQAQPAEIETDKAKIAACKWPRKEGELLLVLNQGNRTDCWVMR